MKGYYKNSFYLFAIAAFAFFSASLAGYAVFQTAKQKFSFSTGLSTFISGLVFILFASLIWLLVKKIIQTPKKISIMLLSGLLAVSLSFLVSNSLSKEYEDTAITLTTYPSASPAEQVEAWVMEIAINGSPINLEDVQLPTEGWIYNGSIVAIESGKSLSLSLPTKDTVILLLKSAYSGVLQIQDGETVNEFNLYSLVGGGIQYQVEQKIIANRVVFLCAFFSLDVLFFLLSFVLLNYFFISQLSAGLFCSLSVLGTLLFVIDINIWIFYPLTIFVVFLGGVYVTSHDHQQQGKKILTLLKKRNNAAILVFINILISYMLLAEGVFFNNSHLILELESFIKIIQFIISMTVIEFTVFSLIPNINYNIKSSDKRKPEFRQKVIIFLVVLIILASLWSIFLYAYFPGNMSPDSIHQYLQAVGKMPLSDWHPAYHTLLMMFLYKFWNNPAIVVMFQIAIFSTITASILTYLYNKGLKWIIVIISAILIGIFPANGVLAVTLWKDVLFSVFLLWVVFIVMRYIDDLNIFEHSVFIHLEFIVAILGVGLFRHNGKLAAALILLFFIFHGFQKRKYKSVFTSFFIGVSLFVLTGPQLVTMGVILNSNSTKYIAPLHDIAGLHYAGSEISEEAREVLFGGVPEKYWDENYYAYSATAILYGNDYNYLGWLEQYSTKEIIKIYFQHFLKYPAQLLHIRLKSSSLLWQISKPPGGYNYRYDTTYGEKENFGITIQENELTKYLNSYLAFTHKNEVMDAIFWRVGWLLVVMLLVGYYILICRGVRLLIVFVPFVSNFISLLLSMCYQDYRYVYFIAIFFIPIMLYLLISINNREASCLASERITLIKQNNWFTDKLLGVNEFLAGGNRIHDKVSIGNQFMNKVIPSFVFVIASAFLFTKILFLSGFLHTPHTVVYALWGIISILFLIVWGLTSFGRKHRIKNLIYFILYSLIISVFLENGRVGIADFMLITSVSLISTLSIQNLPFQSEVNERQWLPGQKTGLLVLFSWIAAVLMGCNTPFDLLFVHRSILSNSLLIDIGVISIYALLWYPIFLTVYYGSIFKQWKLLHSSLSEEMKEIDHRYCNFLLNQQKEYHESETECDKREKNSVIFTANLLLSFALSLYWHHRIILWNAVSPLMSEMILLILIGIHYLSLKTIADLLWSNLATQRYWRLLAVASAVGLALTFLLTGPFLPDTETISITLLNGSDADYRNDGEVWITRMLKGSGKTVENDNILLPSEWVYDEEYNRWYTTQSDVPLEIITNESIAFEFIHHPWSGRIAVEYGDRQEIIDLKSEGADRLVYQPAINFYSYTLLEKGVSFLASFAFFTGVFFLLIVIIRYFPSFLLPLLLFLVLIVLNDPGTAFISGKGASLGVRIKTFVSDTVYSRKLQRRFFSLSDEFAPVLIQSVDQDIEQRLADWAIQAKKLNEQGAYSGTAVRDIFTSELDDNILFTDMHYGQRNAYIVYSQELPFLNLGQDDLFDSSKLTLPAPRLNQSEKRLEGYDYLVKVSNEELHRNRAYILLPDNGNIQLSTAYESVYIIAQESKIQIDGMFSDWSLLPELYQAKQTSSDKRNAPEWQLKAARNGDMLYLQIETSNTEYVSSAGTGGFPFLILFDTDLNSDTGFEVFQSSFSSEDPKFFFGSDAVLVGSTVKEQKKTVYNGETLGPAIIGSGITSTPQKAFEFGIPISCLANSKREDEKGIVFRILVFKFDQGGYEQIQNNSLIIYLPEN